MIPAWLTGIWAKIAGALALLLAAVGFVALRDRRLRREGAEAERRRHQDAAIEHERKSAKQVEDSDESVADPDGERARRVRRQFERND